MIFEILFCSIIIIGEILLIVHFIRLHEISSKILLAVPLSCVIIFLVSLLISGFYVGFLNTNSLEPIKEADLQILDGNYLIKSDKTYYFKYDDKIFHSDSVRTVNIEQTNLEKPKIFICRYKPSLLVPKYFSIISEVYLIVIPSNSVNDLDLSDWLQTGYSE